jgi:predicted Zn-dependent protease
VIGLFVPFGGTITSLAATSIARSFTRDEERAADKQGIRWAVAAGYDPCGKARTVEHFARYSSDGIPLLSTHPSYGERSALADEYARKAGKGC